MKYALILAATLALGACDTLSGFFGDATDKALPLLKQAADTAGKVEDATIGAGATTVADYCSKAPGFVRNGLRDRLNNHPKIDGNKIGVWCKGDPALVLGP